MSSITLTWRPAYNKDNSLNNYCQQSDNYRVSKQLTGRIANYTAWSRGKPWQIVKSRCKSADEAKAECELDHMRKMK